MVACHGKLAVFLLDKEVVQFLLLREFITESDAVVIDTETDGYLSGLLNFFHAFLRGIGRRTHWFGNGLLQQYCQFVVVVTDILGLTPYGLPGLVELLGFFLRDLEAVHQVGFLQTLRGMLVLGQFEAEERGPYHFATLIGHLIDGSSCVIH